MAHTITNPTKDRLEVHFLNGPVVYVGPQSTVGVSDAQYAELPAAHHPVLSAAEESPKGKPADKPADPAPAAKPQEENKS